MLSLWAAILAGAIEVGDWSAPSCPASLLEARVRGGGTPVRVSVRARGDVLVASLEVARGGKVRRRTHEATSCAALIEVLALGVELAQSAEVVANAEAVLAPAPVSAPREMPVESPRTEVQRVQPQRTEAHRRQSQRADSQPTDSQHAEQRMEEQGGDVPRAEAPRAEAQHADSPQADSQHPEQPIEPQHAEAQPEPPPASPLAATAPPSRPELEASDARSSPHPDPLPSGGEGTTTTTSVELGAHALFIFGTAPSATFGAELSASLLPAGLFRLELSLQHSRSATLALGPSRARFSLTTARLGACSPTLKIGPAYGALCASVAAGAIWGQGFATGTITAAREVTLPWVDAAAQARLTVRLTDKLVAEARAGPTFPINRHTFVFDTPTVTLYQTPIVGFEGGLGLAFTP